METALQNSKHDSENLIQEDLRNQHWYLQSMQRTFLEMDADSDGILAIKEFFEALEDERMLAYFDALSLDITDAQSLFMLLDKDRQGTIDVEEFLYGCLRLKGEAKNLDIAKLQLESEWIMHNIDLLMDHFSVHPCEHSGVPSRKLGPGKG